MSDMTPLTALKKGDKAFVADFKPNIAAHLAKLTAFGILPGAEVEVVQVFPAYLIKVGFTQLAIDYELAAHILIHRYK